uniref:Uncharacterized protein n=1 Tax=Arundo donax TaxID=35708 RepID=A0A0A9F1E5_ARUDO
MTLSASKVISIPLSKFIHLRLSCMLTDIRSLAAGYDFPLASLMFSPLRRPIGISACFIVRSSLSSSTLQKAIFMARSWLEQLRLGQCTPAFLIHPIRTHKQIEIHTWLMWLLIF